MSSLDAAPLNICNTCGASAAYRVIPFDGSTSKYTCRKHLSLNAVEGDGLTPLLASPSKVKPIKALKPANDALDEFIGKTLKMDNGDMVLIHKIVGSVPKPTRFEVNGTHHIVMLSAYKQLNGDETITQDMIDAFAEMEVVYVKDPAKPKESDADVIDVTPKP